MSDSNENVALRNVATRVQRNPNVRASIEQVLAVVHDELKKAQAADLAGRYPVDSVLVADPAPLPVGATPAQVAQHALDVQAAADARARGVSSYPAGPVPGGRVAEFLEHFDAIKGTLAAAVASGAPDGTGGPDGPYGWRQELRNRAPVVSQAG